MLKNKLYQYGDENGRVPAHMHSGKEIYDNMVQNKDILALINAGTGEIMTYGEVAQMTANIALSLTRMGVRKGDVVCICSESRFEYLPTVVGIMCAGAIFSPIDPNYASFSLLHRLNIARPKIMFCSLASYKNYRKPFEEIGSIETYIIYGDEPQDRTLLFKEFLTATAKLEDFQPVAVNGDDHVFILFSSGTTGLPKGVPITHLSFLLNSQTRIPSDKYKGIYLYNSRKIYYSYGLSCSLACLRTGAISVFHPSGREKEMLAAVEKYKVKVLFLVPKLITGLIKSSIVGQYNITSVEYIVSAGTYVCKEEVLAIKRRLPHLVSVLQAYGMTEAGSVCNEMASLKGFKPGSCGMPCLGFVIKVVDLTTREPLGPHQRGEICIKGISVMKKYINDALPDCKDQEGFFKTGDLGYYDEDGYFFIVSRTKEVIKYNHLSIAPAEFETLLQQHPAVREAAVVGKPHAQHGEVPTAFVVLQPGRSATAEELVQHCGEIKSTGLAGGVRFIESLPRGASTKLERNKLIQILINEDIH